MINPIDLAAVELELRDKLTHFEPDSEYRQGFKHGLEWALRRLAWLNEGRYARERLEGKVRP